MKDPDELTIEEILAEIVKVEPPEGNSLREMRALLGEKFVNCSDKRARDIVRRAIEAGLMGYAGRRRERRIDGIPCMIPVYRINKKKKK